jgi:2-isopropylmalate synthase
VAASYIGLERMDGRMFWGAGTDTDVITASTNALLSAFYNMENGVSA